MSNMDLGQLIEKYPYMASPAALAMADMGEKFILTPFHERLNRELIEYAFGDTMRLMLNVPFQLGKTTLTTIYNTAWKLLWKPDNQFLIIGAEEEFSWGWGGKIKAVIEKFGPNHGITLKADTRAKGWWQIKGREGGVICKGCHGTVVGKPADDVLCDDLVTGPEDALSRPKMDMRWEFIKTSVYSRLRKHTKMAMVNTRWVKNDPCGRVLEMARKTGEQWRVIKFKALAEEKDIDPQTGVDLIGRKVGEALCPNMVSLEQLKMYQKEWGRWWHAAWQQEPQEEEGIVYSPVRWPRYQFAEGGWLLPYRGALKLFPRNEAVIIVSVDWAASEKKKSDFTSFGAYALIPDRRILVLDCVNKRFRLDESVRALEKFVQKWGADLVVVEGTGFQGEMANKCRAFPGIPEPRRVEPHGKTKLQRSIAAVQLADNHRVYLPENHPASEAWVTEFEDNLTNFTGMDDEFDDIADQFAYTCIEANLLWPQANVVSQGPCMLTPGFQGPFTETGW